MTSLSLLLCFLFIKLLLNNLYDVCILLLLGYFLYETIILLESFDTNRSSSSVLFILYLLIFINEFKGLILKSNEAGTF
jgi:hypothetical protein